jgi:hypothetical protein
MVLTMFIYSCQNDEQVTNNITKSQLVKDQSRKITQDWTSLYLDIEKDLPGFRPNPTARALAHVNLAAYEAGRPGMPDFVSYSTMNNEFEIPAPNPDLEYYWPAAINAAYFSAMEYFLHNATNEHRDKMAALYTKYEQEFRSVKGESVIKTSADWGKTVGEAVISFGKSDTQAEIQVKDPRPKSHIPPQGLGLWKSTDSNPHGLFPYWGETRAFFASEADQIVYPPRSIYSTAEGSDYKKQALEVYNRGKIGAMTDEDLWQAEFWSDDFTGMTFSPPGRVFAIANQLIDIYNLNLEETLHLYLKLGLGSHDAAICAWNSKYIYNLERPVTYINEVLKDSEWKPVLGRALGSGKEGITPPFPAYPSGHSTFGGYSSQIFISFFGDATNFTDRCHEGRQEFYGTPRNFRRFEDLGAENAYSRIPLGVHWRMDCESGLQLGSVVAKNIINAKFKIR